MHSWGFMLLTLLHIQHLTCHTGHNWIFPTLLQIVYITLITDKCYTPYIAKLPLYNTNHTILFKKYFSNFGQGSRLVSALLSHHQRSFLLYKIKTNTETHSRPSTKTKRPWNTQMGYLSHSSPQSSRSSVKEEVKISYKPQETDETKTKQNKELETL